MPLHLAYASAATSEVWIVIVGERYVEVKSQDDQTVIGNLDTERRLGTYFVTLLKKIQSSDVAALYSHGQRIF